MRYINEQEPAAFLSYISMNQVTNSPESKEWLEAMATKIKTITKNKTCKLVERPKNTKVIGSQIVLRNKYIADGTPERRTARLAAQGFSK